MEGKDGGCFLTSSCEFSLDLGVMVQHRNHLVYAECVTLSNPAIASARLAVRHHGRKQIYQGSALCAHNVAKHFVAHGRIISSVILLALEVFLGSFCDLVSEISVIINEANLLHHAVDDLAEVQTKVDILVICLDFFRLFNGLSSLLRLSNVLQLAGLVPYFSMFEQEAGERLS